MMNRSPYFNCIWRGSAPAKINSYLELLAKRADGFHDLETVFQSVNLCDIVQVEIKKSDQPQVQIFCQCPGISLENPHENLAYRAAKLFHHALCERDLLPKTSYQEIHINIEKHIPAGGGLGGGSSDAAAVLRALNYLCHTPLTNDELEMLGAQLGSDVSFFVRCGTAYARGRGELLQAIDEPSEAIPLSIICPPFGCSTPQVFNALSSEERGPRAAQELSQLPQLTDQLEKPINRLAAAACRIAPELADILAALQSIDSRAQISGSGSSIFCIGHLQQNKLDEVLHKKHGTKNLKVHHCLSLSAKEALAFSINNKN